MIAGQDAIDKPTSVGPPVPTVSVKIVDDVGEELGVGETGEVCITGPILMAGYWNKPEATADAIDADGWLHTGDIGYLDEEGFLFITDRKKDMIIRGGENIYCVEIEQRLVEPPGDRRRRRRTASPPGARRRGQGHRPARGGLVAAGGRRASSGSPTGSPTSRCRPTSTSPSTSSPATPAASC